MGQIFLEAPAVPDLLQVKLAQILNFDIMQKVIKNAVSEIMVNLVQRYVSKVTNGIIILQDHHIIEIFNIMVNNADKIHSVTINRYNGLTHNYEPLRTIPTSLKAVEIVKEKLLRPWKGFYRYDIIDPDGQVLECLYSLNPSLFD